MTGLLIALRDRCQRLRPPTGRLIKEDGGAVPADCVITRSPGSIARTPQKKATVLLGVAMTCLLIDTTTADDTEIFFNAENIPPNIMFIVDVSGSMNWTDGTPLPDIPGNVLWLDAADKNTLLDAQGDLASWGRFSGYVSTWMDKSGKGNHLTGSTATLGNINGLSTVRFTDDIMTGPDIFGGTMSEATIFLVQQENAQSKNFFLNFNGDDTSYTGRISLHTPWSNNRNWYWDAGSIGNDRSIIRRPTAVGEVAQLTAFKTVAGNQNGISLNNGSFSAIDPGAAPAASSGGMYFGRGVSDHELAELIVYDRMLSESEIKIVEQHLDQKWRTRLERTKVALSTLLESSDSFNAGLMTYSSYTRGQFSLRDEIKPLTESRDSLISHIDSLYASGGTPTQSAMFEAMRHFRGEAPIVMEEINSSGQPPLVQCQSNHIVLLTDGEPYGGSSWPSIGDYIGSDCATNRGDNRIRGNCGIELAKYMKENDHYPTVRGINSITTHTIGLSLDMPWLDDMATAGGGGYYSVGTSDQLLTAFESIMDAAFDQSTTFVTPAVTIDQLSQMSHRDDAYLALFQPTNSMRWPGNLKRYNFSGSPPTLKDQNNKNALDRSTASFAADAQSFWSDTADGAYTQRGGAAGELDAATRKLTTYTGNGGNYLLDSRNRIHEDNAAALGSWFTETGDQLSNLLAWARGVDVDDEDSDGSITDTRQQMGDPLHSRPTILTYDSTTSEPDSVVFVGTNEGYLHAISSIDGSELFSFIPTDLLGNLNVFYENNTGLVRPYGLDGDITLWVDDTNRNGTVDSQTEQAYLYIGMRRGGQNYYALDVTEKNNPKYLWAIKGGSGDFAELGQSWSKPTKAKIHIGGTIKDVLIFGGGYDPAQDYATTRSADTIGNTLFIVDAVDGSLIWKTATDTGSDYSQMLYSMPSDPSLVDVDGDGITDQMYIGDLGGQIWRFDFNHDATGASDLITGGLIADLAASDEKNNRRFFYPPDVAITAKQGKTFLTLSIGSGNRSHPLGSNVDNRFYMIRQDQVYKAPEAYGIGTSGDPATYRAVEEADLYDATANDIENTDSEIALAAKDALEDAPGWMLKLDDNGEKVLGTSVTIDHSVVFATYLPDGSGQTNDACQPATGHNRSYVVSLLDATPVNGTDPGNRYDDIDQSGIAGSVSVIISGDTTENEWSVDAVTGLNTIDTPTVNLTRRTYWSESPNF